MTQLSTPPPLTSSSRRSWLKGIGTLFGAGLLTAPSALLAAPAAAPQPEAASALVGGSEYIGIVKLMAGRTVPQGWALCDGRTLRTHEHPALFAILGTTYGGDGVQTFCLPNLCNETPTDPHAETTVPPMHCAIKVANAPAAPEALAELHMHHHRQSRRRA